jgi:acetate kinase
MAERTATAPSLSPRPWRARLRELVPLAPLLQPHNLAGIAAVRAVRPDLAQIACFDTAFHHTLPRLARLFALPRDLHEAGIRRYGFHGLSYEYVVEALRRRNIDLDRERIIVAHLGNGASMCALRGGRSVETTMGFSTLAGLMMGTRSGDLDPGVVLYPLTRKGLSPADILTLLYQQSGLRGVSGMTSDMRELLARRSESAAGEAVDLFCYRARHHLAALTAAIGGLDRIVFTGGIGAHAPEIRQGICAGLAYLGVTVDASANTTCAPTISAPHAPVTVKVLASDEEVMIVATYCGSLSARKEAERRTDMAKQLSSLQSLVDQAQQTARRPGAGRQRRLVISKGVFLKDLPADVIANHLWPLALIATVTLSGATWLFRYKTP